MDKVIDRYDALPSRQAIKGHPLPGVVYRDEGQPECVFLAALGDDKNWSRYSWQAFAWRER